MTTSGTITYLSTARDLIKGALELIGVADNHEDADSYATALRQMNWMLKTMQADGCNLWREDEKSITWTAGNQVQTLTPNIMDILDARVVISSTFERTLGRFERGDYVVLPNKAASGAPTLYSFQKRTGNAKMNVWPVPTTDTTINLTVARVIEDVTDLNQTLDLPQEWQETIVYQLADRLCEPFSVALSQPMVAAEVKKRASELYTMLRDYDRPTSIFFKPWERS